MVYFPVYTEAVMAPTRLQRTLLVLFGVLFLLSILTVESHANEKGPVAARLPTIVDGTIDFALAVTATVEAHICIAIAFLLASYLALLGSRTFLSPRLYRGPPSRIL